MKHKIDTVIFDLGGVLVDWDPIYVFKDVFKGDEEKLDFFLSSVCNHDWNIEQDAGRTIQEAVAIKTKEFPEFTTEIHLFYEKWHLMFSGVFQENVALLQQFKANSYKVFALTNWSAETWPRALELFPFFNDFDGVIVSGIEKMRKPFEPIYRLILTRFEIDPLKAIFIDDKLENIEAANKIGLHGIHYKSHKELVLQLKNFQMKF